MFTKTEEALIQELREQKAPLERWAKFFPQHKIVDLMEKPKPVCYLFGKPVYAEGAIHDSVSYRIGEVPSGSYVPNPCAELPCAAAYARSKKKGNIYLWDDMQDSFLAGRFKTLRLLNPDKISIETLIKEIKFNFGIERTPGAICTRLESLGFNLYSI